MRRLIATALTTVILGNLAAAQPISRGEAEYLNSCAVCHGIEGKGDGPLGDVLMKRPADLTRLTFTTDIAPTIYALRNHPVRDLGPLFGAPLFVPQGQTLADRRRESFLLTSSYGPTFGLLRRNGQFLYVTDLLEWRDFAYDLARAPAEQPMVIDRDLRSLNEREIRARLDDLASLYHITW